MQVLNINEIKTLDYTKTAVALGSFEALHAGHIKIIENTIKCAKENNTKSIITIFRKPVLKDRSLLCETLDERLKIIDDLGADTVVIFDFNEEFKSLEYTEFFYNYIVKKFNAAFLFTGFNYRFGYKAMGNTDNLLSLCNENEIILNVTPAVTVNEVVSSTYIHKLIELGEAEKLNDTLLRPYSITGRVTNGRKIGKELGFPTANIEFPDNKAIIKNGVYFGTATTDYGTNYAIINVGLQPTISDEFTPKIEAYLFDFKNDLYGSIIKLNFLKRMRDIKRFTNIDELKLQLKNDKIQAEKIIKANT